MTTAMQIGETARDRADFSDVSRQAPPYFCTMMGLLRILLTEIPSSRGVARNIGTMAMALVWRPLLFA
jgi:hypothetical protein